MDSLSDFLNAHPTFTTISVLVALAIVTWVGGGLATELTGKRRRSEIPPDDQLP